MSLAIFSLNYSSFSIELSDATVSSSTVSMMMRAHPPAGCNYLLFLQEQIKDIIIISTRVKHEGRCDVTRFTHLVTSHCHRRHGRARRGGAQLICGARSPRGVDGRAEGSMIDACVCSVCVFITAGPITKLFAWGGGDIGGHVLRDYEPRPVYVCSFWRIPKKTDHGLPTPRVQGVWPNENFPGGWNSYRGL
jgi:hypothetical protein